MQFKDVAEVWTSTRRRKSLGGLNGESFALIGPFEGFGLQVLHAFEGAALEQLAHQDAEPDLYLVHSGSVPGGTIQGATGRPVAGKGDGAG
jgi:hypothetical protein